MEKFYTPAEVADLLRITRRTLYRWIESGKLKPKRAGWTWLISEKDIEELLHSEANKGKGGE